MNSTASEPAPVQQLIWSFWEHLQQCHYAIFYNDIGIRSFRLANCMETSLIRPKKEGFEYGNKGLLCSSCWDLTCGLPLQRKYISITIIGNSTGTHMYHIMVKHPGKKRVMINN